MSAFSRLHPALIFSGFAANKSPHIIKILISHDVVETLASTGVAFGCVRLAGPEVTRAAQPVSRFDAVASWLCLCVVRCVRPSHRPAWLKICSGLLLCVLVWFSDRVFGPNLPRAVATQQVSQVKVKSSYVQSCWGYRQTTFIDH